LLISVVYVCQLPKIVQFCYKQKCEVVSFNLGHPGPVGMVSSISARD